MKNLIAMLLALSVAACAAAPRPFAGPDPSNPSARVAAVSYRSTIGSFTSQRPAEPAPWGQRNERVAPQPKSDQ
jgi:hypothetical protein